MKERPRPQARPFPVGSAVVRRAPPAFHAFSSVSQALVSPLDFSLASFAHGAPLSLRYFVAS